MSYFAMDSALLGGAPMLQGNVAAVGEYFPTDGLGAAPGPMAGTVSGLDWWIYATLAGGAVGLAAGGYAGWRLTRKEDTVSKVVAIPGLAVVGGAVGLFGAFLAGMLVLTARAPSIDNDEVP